MNCANHPDRERAAFCQNCGKPLCSECARGVGSSVFCEPCLIARVAGGPPPGFGFAPGAPPIPPAQPGEPNPTIAALLGIIPGAGAMYNGQYAKGIVHLIVFVILISLADGGPLMLFALGWICYMMMEAHHTARARRDGALLPNPFGLNDIGERMGFGNAWSPRGSSAPGNTYPPHASATGAAQTSAAGTTYSAGESQFHTGPDGSQTYTAPGTYFRQGPDGSQTFATPGGLPYADAAGAQPPPPPPGWNAPHDPFYAGSNLDRFPAGAGWLIGLGLFFLAGSTRYFHVLRGRLVGPLALIALGVWVFFRKMTEAGQTMENDGTPQYRWRLNQALSRSVWLVLLGVVALLHMTQHLNFSRALPFCMIAFGIVLLLQRTGHPGPFYGPPIYPAQPVAPAAPPPPPPGTAIVVAPPETAVASATEDRQIGREGD
jgi:hypothetical protein